MSNNVEVHEGALGCAHLAVENALVELRDSRIGVLGPANGFVIRERDGKDSSILRLGTRDGLRIAIKAYLEALYRGDAEVYFNELREQADDYESTRQVNEL